MEGLEIMNDEPKRRSSSAAVEDLRQMYLVPPGLRREGRGGGQKRQLAKQLSMRETSRDVAWERRRRQILLLQERRRNGVVMNNNGGDGGGGSGECADHELTDDDLNELKGCIELGFGFNEEDGQRLCGTLPALDLYFAVNRQFLSSPLSTPKSHASTSSSSAGRYSPFGSPRSDSDSWKICSPGDDPEQVKTKLRHWAQAVACSVLQSYP